MKILVNASTLVVGGGIQIGVSFIENVFHNKEFKWLFLVSSGIYDNLEAGIKSDSRVVCIERSPAGILKGIKSRQRIKRISKEFDPNLIYSIGFPSYIRFSKIEIGRYTNPWEFNKKPLPWHTIHGLHRKIIIRLGISYRRFWARNADYIETQTEAAKNGIAKKVPFPKKRIKVIPNSLNSVFLEERKKKMNCQNIYDRENIAFSLAAPYEHKNLDLIPQVASILKKDYGISLKFILTIPKSSSLWLKIQEEAKNLKVSELVINVGVLKIKDCLDYYKKSKLVFLPTLLEVFSATYIESMAMRVPIITSDLEFAHDNCKDGALYFEAGNAHDAALKIKQILLNKELQEKLIEKGERVLMDYPSSEQKYLNLFNYFKKIIEYERK